MRDLFSRGVRLVAIIFILGVTLAAAWGAQQGYITLVQQPMCIDYVTAMTPDAPSLSFSGVVIATGQHRDHECIFRDDSTGAPLVIKFQPGDVPIAADTMQVLCMAGTAVCLGPSLFLTAGLLLRRLRLNSQG